MRPVGAAAVAALLISSAVSQGLAREHGAPRDVGTITTIVVHTVGGPTCMEGKVTFKPIPFRADDAAFWRDALRSAPVADAHLVIGRNGTVARVLLLSEVANHTVGANDLSIGIELVHRGDGGEPFEPAEITSLIETIKRLRRDNSHILLNNLVGHSDLDRRTCICGDAPYHRRQDPGANFPWQQVVGTVRLPTDPPRGKTLLTPLTGPAPPDACMHR